jgi:cell division protein FtsL
MATVAANFMRTGFQAVPTASADAWAKPLNDYRLRPLPGEDVYFYIKKIDNSRLVREADPAAGRKTLKALAKGAAAIFLLLLLLMPKALEVVAGYHVQMLAREHDRMLNEKAVLDLEEARLVNPDRLEQLARELKLVNPDPKRVVVINAKADSALAYNVAR